MRQRLLFQPAVWGAIITNSLAGILTLFFVPLALGICALGDRYTRGNRWRQGFRIIVVVAALLVPVMALVIWWSPCAAEIVGRSAILGTMGVLGLLNIWWHRQLSTR